MLNLGSQPATEAVVDEAFIAAEAELLVAAALQVVAGGLSTVLTSEVATPDVVGGLLVAAVDLLAAPSSAKFVENIIMLRGTADIGLITLILDRLHRHLKRSMLQTLLNQMVIGS